MDGIGIPLGNLHAQVFIRPGFCSRLYHISGAAIYVWNADGDLLPHLAHVGVLAKVRGQTPGRHNVRDVPREAYVVPHKPRATNPLENEFPYLTL